MKSCAGALLLVFGLAQVAAAGTFYGQVVDDRGEPVAGAMLSFERGAPARRVTIFSDDEGRYRSPDLPDTEHGVRVRRIGWADLEIAPRSPGELDLSPRRLSDAADVAAQLPAHHWFARVVDRVDDASAKTWLKRECTYCHQQGNSAVRRERSEAEWRELITQMVRRGAVLPGELRAQLPQLFIAAYDPGTAIPELTQGFAGPDYAPSRPPSLTVRRAIIEEWDLGSRASMQHDAMLHPDGRLYSVDSADDAIHRLAAGDPQHPEGLRHTWKIPHEAIGDAPMGDSGRPRRAGPHSLQTAPDGSIWITLASSNQLARFDPETEVFELHEVAKGVYPHTLRFDSRGRVWYTLAASNHVGMFDPATGKQRHVRLPARSFGQAMVLRMMPLMLWIDRHSNLRDSSSESGGGFTMPVPYGIDIAPDDGVWFSQLNDDRIGRIDPDRFKVELIDTPFPAPRRLRFGPQGRLWIPSFSDASISAFDPATGVFETWELPIRPLAGETPYALAVDPHSGHVWVCGTNSDTLIRFDPESERFDVYPLPTRVTYTRDIDFDAEGRVWTSNSNSPSWQIEGGQPIVLRLDPRDADEVVRLGDPPH